MHYAFHITSCSFFLSFRTALKSHNPLELLYFTAPTRLPLSPTVSLSLVLLFKSPHQEVPCAPTSPHTQVVYACSSDRHLYYCPTTTHKHAHVERGFQDPPALSCKYAHCISNQNNVGQQGILGKVWQGDLRLLEQFEAIVHLRLKNDPTTSARSKQIDSRDEMWESIPEYYYNINVKAMQ